MDDLVVISTSIVQPKNVNQSGRVKKIHLNPWDLVRLRFCYPQRCLLFHKPDQKMDIIITQLQTSLSIALDRFYPLAGRLVKEVNEEDGTVSFFISCDGPGPCPGSGSSSGSGVKFVHAAARNMELSDALRSFEFVPGAFSSFFPANGVKNYEGVSNPLFMVQVTEMKDGIIIGYGYNHTVADGKSIWMLINAWSEICLKDLGSGDLEDCPPLQMKGWFLDGVDYPIHVPDPEIKGLSYVSTTTNFLQEKVFRFTKKNVLKLKAKANDEAGSADGKISTFQAVLGHIWRSTVRHSGMSREEETHCRVPADMRQRIHPPLEEMCFGNVIQTGTATVNVGELLDHGLGWAAMEINKMVRSQTSENAKEFAENWVKNVEIPTAVSCTLLVTSCPRFNVYGNDFGWGKPIGARSGLPHNTGKLVAFQGIEEGSLEFQAYLPPEVVVKLLKDVEFLEYADIA